MSPDFGMLGPTHGGDDDDEEEEEQPLPKLKLDSKNLESDNNVRDILNEIVMLYMNGEKSGKINDIRNQIINLNLRWHKPAIFQLLKSTLSNPEQYYSVYDIPLEQFVKYSIMFYMDKQWKDDMNKLMEDAELDPKSAKSLSSGISSILNSDSEQLNEYKSKIIDLLKSMLRDPNRMLIALYCLNGVKSTQIINQFKKYLLLILPGSSTRVRKLIFNILINVVNENESIIQLFENELKSENIMRIKDILDIFLKHKQQTKHIKDKITNLLNKLENDTKYNTLSYQIKQIKNI